MSTEEMVKVYWPGEAFDVTHHARKFVVATGDNELPESLATKLKQRFSLNGLVGLPVATVDEQGNAVEPSAELITAVKVAADKRNASAHRLAGQNPIKFDAEGKPAPPTEALVRDRAGFKLDVPAAKSAPEPEQESKTGDAVPV